MTAANNTILTCYEELGMSPADIAEAEGLDITAVKATLIQCSAKYRAETQEKPDLDFRDDDLARVNDVIRNIALYADDANLQFRAAKFIRQDKKGRLDVQSGLKALNINVTVFNQHLERTRKQMSRARELGCIDVQSQSSDPEPAQAENNQQKVLT